MAPAHPSATVLLLRDQPHGVEVFMVKRHRRSGFLPSVWVFPGGRVDPADALAGHPRVHGGEALLHQLGLPPAEAVAVVVAAVRETYEEAGIWLGSGALPELARDSLNSGGSLVALLDRYGVELDLGRLAAWSRWVTPQAEPRRYDTRFLVAAAPDAEGSPDEHEVVASGWFSPTTQIAPGFLEHFPMAPPTWWTLHELAAYRTVAEVLAACPGRSQRPIEPILRFSERGLRFVLPGHPDHPEAAVGGLPPEVEYRDGSWVSVVAAGDNRV